MFDQLTKDLMAEHEAMKNILAGKDKNKPAKPIVKADGTPVKSEPTKADEDKKDADKAEPKRTVKKVVQKDDKKDEPKDSGKPDSEKADKADPKDTPKKGDSRPIKNSALEAITEAFQYAKTDSLNKDVQAAIQGEPITDNLRKTLEVLVDNEKFCQFLLSQCEVAKSRERDRQYTLSHKYVDIDGDGIPDVAIEALGNRDLGLYNIEIKVIRTDKDGKEIGEATAAEAEKYLKELNKAKDTPKGGDKGGSEPNPEADEAE